MRALSANDLAASRVPGNKPSTDYEEGPGNEDVGRSHLGDRLRYELYIYTQRSLRAEPLLF